MSRQTPPNDWITTTEAARLVGRSPETIIRWLLHGGLRARRVRTARGYRYQVHKPALLARLEAVQAPPPPVPLSEDTLEGLRRHGLA